MNILYVRSQREADGKQSSQKIVVLSTDSEMRIDTDIRFSATELLF
jgi:hypothetical protein